MNYGLCGALLRSGGLFCGSGRTTNLLLLHLIDVVQRRSGKSLSEVQCDLAKKGAAVLVVDLVMKSQNRHRIFVEAVELGIALLEGGNREIQDMLYDKLKGSDKCQNFFKVGNWMGVCYFYCPFTVTSSLFPLGAPHGISGQSTCLHFPSLCAVCNISTSPSTSSLYIAASLTL